MLTQTKFASLLEQYPSRTLFAVTAFNLDDLLIKYRKVQVGSGCSSDISIFGERCLNCILLTLCQVYL